MQIFLPPVHAAQLTWTSPSSTPSSYWHAVAMSADGTKIVGAVYGGHIWTSSDSGSTWSDRSGPGNQNWLGVAVTESSSVIYGVFSTGANSGGVYRSADFGTSWTLTNAPTNCSYVGVATSGSTNVSVACTGTGAGIYANTNAGVGASNTWSLSSGTTGLNFTDLRSSSNGSKLIASVWAGGIYLASDGTFAYVNKVSSPLTSYCWSGVGINSDGTKLIAVERGAPGYGTGGNVFISTDSGSNWVASSGANGANAGAANGDWMSAAISSDGSTLAVVAFGSPSRISVSQDGGTTWMAQSGTSSLSFINVAVSSNGRRFIATTYGEKLYLSSFIPAPTANSLSLTNGPLAGGTTSVLTGTGLTGTTGIMVGGTAATGINVISDTQVSFITPSAISIGAKDVVITTPGGSGTISNGFTYLSAAPSVPTVSAMAQDSSAVLLITPGASNGNPVATDYLIQYSSTSGITWNTFSHSPSPNISQTVTGLTNGTTYIFQVAAVNASATSLFSSYSNSIISGQTIDFSSPPGTATLLKFRTLSFLKVTVSSNGKVTFYANNRRIPGCINIVTSSSATCSYKPMTHGGIQLTALVTPDSGNPYSVPISIGVANRTTPR